MPDSHCQLDALASFAIWRTGLAVKARRRTLGGGLYLVSVWQVQVLRTTFVRALTVWVGTASLHLGIAESLRVRMGADRGDSEFLSDLDPLSDVRCEI